MVNKTTVLLLLKDRTEFTKRWLHVHNDINFNIPVHIADGSLNDCNERIISDFISRKNNLNITYKHYGKDTNLNKFYSKIINSIEDIDSKYVILSCNDDFLIKESILEGSHFLDNNHEFVATAGPVFDTTMCQTKTSHNQIRGILSHPINQYPAFDRIEELAESRIYNYLSGRKNSYIWSALHRKNVLLETSKVIHRISPPDLRFQEHLNALLTLAKGKVSGGMQCMTLHQSNTMESEGAKIMNNLGTWYKWLQTNEWLECYTKMVIEIVNLIEPKDKSTKKELNRRIEFYYQALIGQLIIREFHQSYKEELFVDGEQIPKNSHVYGIWDKISKIIS